MLLNRKSVFHLIAVCVIVFISVAIWEYKLRNIYADSQTELPILIPYKAQHDTVDLFKSSENKKTFSTKYRNLLVKIQKHLSVAHRYSRSAKSMMEIYHAFGLLQKIIKVGDKERLAQNFNYQNKDSQSGSKDNLVDVCPEVMSAITDNIPMMNSQLKIANCSNSRPLNTIVGFVIMTPNCSTARDIVDGIVKNYRHMEVSVGIESSDQCNIKDTYSSSLKLLDINIGMKVTGRNWKILAKKLSTKYVLIARNLYTFNNQSSLERLVQIISESGIEAVGGPQRFDDGRWMSGCYQMAMRNYTLRLLEGYDLSYKSCMYCDYLSTAFLTRPQNLNKLDDMMEGNSVFIDYFIQLFNEDRIGAMMCADVMFSSDYQDINDQPRPIWRQIVIKYSLNRIHLPNNQDVWFDCVESKVGCPKRQGEVVPPCCLKELDDAFLIMMKICYKRKLNCTVIVGSAVGSLKFYGVLPWERDHDLLFHSKNYSAFGDELRKQGYEVSYLDMSNGKSDICKPKNNYDCMYFAYRSKHWRISMFGARWITSDNRGDYREPTRTLYNGLWINTHTNPGRYARITYGDDIFKHVEHYGTWGYSSGWSNYTVEKNGIWMKCQTGKFFHGCLDNFMPSGNIQFNDVWI